MARHVEFVPLRGWRMGRQASGKGGGRGAGSKRGGDSSYQRTSTLDASILGLGGGAVPSLGGGAMNLASRLGGGGLTTQINGHQPARSRLR